MSYGNGMLANEHFQHLGLPGRRGITRFNKQLPPAYVEGVEAQVAVGAFQYA